MALDNKSLGKFILDGIPPAPRGMPQIEVTFNIDANGILEVTAQDKASGREQHITITAGSGLKDDEIERMVEEARQHADEDLRRKETAELRNAADNTIFTAEKLLADFEAQLPEDTKAQTQEKIDALRQAMEGEDIDALRAANDDLAQFIQALGAQMHQQQGAGEPEPDPASEAKRSPDDEDVVDAIFRSISADCVAGRLAGLSAAPAVR